MLNPLLLPGVLENLMGYLEVNELQNSRLVSAQWNFEACKALRLKKKIIFKKTDTLLSYADTFSKSLCTASLNFPHSIYELRFRFQKQDIPSVENFFLKFGYKIKTLYLIIGGEFYRYNQLCAILQCTPYLETLQLHFYYSFNSSPISSNEVISFPSIKKLELEVTGYDESSEESPESFLHGFFSLAINLEIISYLGELKRTPSKLKVLFTTIILSSPPGTLRRLSKLEYLMRLNEDSLQTMITKSFPLESLYLELWTTEPAQFIATTSSLEKFLTPLRPCLKSLSIDFPFGEDISYSFRFPDKMFNLNFLCITAYQGSIYELLKYLPVLNKLELSQLSLEDGFPRRCQNPMQGSNSVCVSVRNLKIEFCTDQNPSVFRRIAKYFPSILQLAVTHASNEITKVIFKEMPNLRVLIIQSCSLTDEGICGIPDDIIKSDNLNQNVHSLFRTDIKHLRKYPYIGDLKELRRIELDTYLITDVAVVYGIVDCPHFEFLSMNYSELTDTSIKAFELKFGRQRSFESKHRIVI